VEEDKDSRSRSVSGSRTYAGGDTAKGIGIQLHGVLKGKEQLNDIREVPGVKVQVSEQGVLVPRVLRRHGR